jgi:predicted transporter
MLRIFLGVTVGFVVWSILWVGVDAILRAVWTSYDESVKSMTFSSSMLIVPLVLSAVVSIISGFVAALISRENSKSSLILGILLLIVGIFVQMSVWDKIPLWYHLTFLILLIPMTILGGKLRTEK